MILLADSINDLVNNTLNHDTGIPAWIWGLAIIAWGIRLSIQDEEPQK
jgi:hypothetical protein